MIPTRQETDVGL
jgi:hypothetical protein